MRVITFIIVLAVSVAVLLYSVYKVPYDPVGSVPSVTPLTDAKAQTWLHKGSASVSLILDLERYEDPDYGFSLGVPAGWTRIVADSSELAEADDVLASLEPGYAVGFESPRSHSRDRFADYILIEVLPGDDSGLFASTPENQRYLRIGDEYIAYDRLDVDSDKDEAIDVDLVIFQRGVRAIGYTLSFYAIGEPDNEQVLFDAFQIMLRTYEQSEDPFVII